MNRLLDEISGDIDGLSTARLGHNFPVTAVPESHPIHSELQPGVQYVVAYLKGDIGTLKHELAHARFATDENYHQEVVAFWAALGDPEKATITAFLKRLGYSDAALIDEFQAYAVTEKSNFFGVRLEVEFGGDGRDEWGRERRPGGKRRRG